MGKFENDENKAIQFKNAGLNKLKEKNLDEAIADFIEAIILDPTSSESYLWLGIAKYRKKDFDGSLVDFIEAIRLNPEDYRNYSIFFQAHK